MGSEVPARVVRVCAVRVVYVEWDGGEGVCGEGLECACRMGGCQHVW